MNKKGFTLVELLATLVILGIVVGLTIVGVNSNIDNTKKKTEEVFIGTIKDAVKMYLDSDARKLGFSSKEVCSFSKALKDNIKVYKTDSNVTISTIIDSKYSPLLESDLVNPNNKDAECYLGAPVEIYRDEDYVYYYKIKKEHLDCLTFDLDGFITNLPDECISS